NRAEDRNVLKADVAWLSNVHINGAYTYDDRFNRQRADAQPVKNLWLEGNDFPDWQILAHNGEPIVPGTVYKPVTVSRPPIMMPPPRAYDRPPAIPRVQSR